MKIFLSNLNESWVVDRFREDWYINNPDISTNNIKEADIIWIISPWTWKKISKKFLKNKKVICSIYHIDFEKFDNKEKKDFYNREKYVDEYHVISLKTNEQLKSLTNKKISSIPFWIDNKIFYEIDNNVGLRNKFGFKISDYIVGSFQRDTEGNDLISPKLIKGPDIFFEIVKKMYFQNPNLKILLTGKRRQYLINRFKQESIPYIYFEMVDVSTVNELYNILDLYLVTSRLEGGPQAILECALTKTPILSTDVGIASEILNINSIFENTNIENCTPDVDFAYNNAINFTIPRGMKNYIKMFKSLYDN